MHMRLQFVDRSIAKHEGKIEDILVKVDKFLFHADFIILDYEANQEVPIIFGRPFLSTGHALIDVHQGELTMRFNDEVKFNVMNAMKFPTDDKNYSMIESLGGTILRKKYIKNCSALKNSLKTRT